VRITTVLAKYLIQLQADGRSPFWRDQIDRHIRFLDRWLRDHRMPGDVRRVTHEHIAAFLASPEANTRRDGRPKRATSTNALRSSVKTYLRFAFAAGYADRDAGMLIRRARCSPPPPRAIAPDDLKRLLATVDSADGWTAERDAVLFRALAETGVRIGSLLAATVEDLDLRHRELRLTTTKNNRPTVVPLPRELCRRLRHYLGERTSGPLFPAQGGRPVTGRQARRRMSQWLAKAGCRPASPHGLRHAFAERVYARSKDIAVVQAALHHRSIASTLIYARPSEQMGRRALTR
jgi:site-specific recombinase XerD